MRVAVDARHLAGGRGVAHYTSELLTALATGFPGDEWRAFVPGRGPVASGAAPAGGAAPPSGAAPAGAVHLVRHPLPSRALFGSAALLGRPRLDWLAGGADVVWIPAPAPVAVSRGTPYVLTVHDLSWIERPGDFTPYERLWHRLARIGALVRRAAAVVAVSEAARRAVAARWPREVAVVRSGIPSLPPPAPRPPWLPERYVLCVGALEPRKAPDVLVQAADGLDVDLVFAGSGRLAPRLRRDRVHVVEHADRAMLATLYRHALALALPSRLEGFGFTPLEAARAGVPVVARNLPVLDETLGDAALRVEDDRWAEALRRVVADEDLRRRLAARGREAAARFSWERTATEMHAILERAAR